MNIPPYIVLIVGWVVVFGVLLVRAMLKIAAQAQTRITAHGTIGGNVNKEIRLSDKVVKPKMRFGFKELLGLREKIDPGGYSFVGHICGDSLEIFGLRDGTMIFCKEIAPENIRRFDALVIEANGGINAGKPKGRICLGKWGDPSKPDQDLIDVEGHTGSVVEYFEQVAPAKYNYEGPYEGPIEGWLKTLSCDRIEYGIQRKISRPHDPSKILGRIEYIVEPDELEQYFDVVFSEPCMLPA